MPNTITPTALATSVILQYLAPNIELGSIIYNFGEKPTQAERIAAVEALRAALLAEIDRRIPIPA